MKATLLKSTRRLLALAAAVVLAIGLFGGHALAQEDWQQLQLFLRWTDGSGQEQEVQAYPEVWSTDQRFWAEVDESVPLDQVVLGISHPLHGYTFQPADGALISLQEQMISDTTALLLLSAYDGAGELADVYQLYVSTEGMPEPAAVEILWVTDEGEELARRTELVAPGESKTIAGDELPGYTYASAQTQLITVDDQGTATPSQVTFLMIPLQGSVPDAQVSVEYRLDGTTIAMQTVACPAGGVTEITADEQALSGYEVLGQKTVTVTVDAQGVPDRDTVVFDLTPAAPQEAQVQVLYLDVDTGAQVASSQEYSLPEGIHDIFAEPVGMDAEYEPAGEQTAQVTVAGGVASPETVRFMYRRAPQATATSSTAAIVVRCLSAEDGSALAPAQTYLYSDGDYVFSAADAQLGQEYTVLGSAEVTVHVEGGVAQPAEVVFSFVRADSPTEQPTEEPTSMPTQQAPFSALLTVHLRSAGGTDLMSYPVYFSSQGSFRVGADSTYIPEGYEWTGNVQQVTANADGTVSPAEISFTLTRRTDPAETPIPEGEAINRWAQTTKNDVRLRAEPSTKANMVTNLSTKGTYVWALKEEKNSAGEKWTSVLVGGQAGYIRSDLISVMSQAESEDYQETLPTPAPTLQPTEGPTATQPPAAPTLPPDQYAGYAVTVQEASLCYEIEKPKDTVMLTLPVDELVSVAGQTTDSAGTTWSYVTLLDGTSGFVPDGALRRLTAAEAEPYLSRWQEAHPTQTPTARETGTPVQITGYAYTIGDDVPFRSTYSDRSVILGILAKNTAVYVNGQMYDTEDGWPWHMVQYAGKWGYIRADLLRMMTDEEQRTYLEGSGTPTPQPKATPEPYTGETLSSYGYIYAKNGGAVNVRREPSTGSSKVSSLKNYALCLIYGTSEVGGKTWYNISYNNIKGYVSGDYFKQLTIDELTKFIGSEEYLEGIRLNTGDTATPKATFTSREQELIGEYQDPGSGVTYATWVPIATTAPLPTETASGSPEETAEIPTLEPITTVSYEPLTTPEPIATIEPVQEETSGGSRIIVWVIIILLLLVAGGAAYVWWLHRKNRMNAARRAAQRRPQPNPGQRPPQASRPTGTRPPTTGSYPQQGRQNPSQMQGSTSAQNGNWTAQRREAQAQPSPYARPESRNAGNPAASYRSQGVPTPGSQTTQAQTSTRREESTLHTYTPPAVQSSIPADSDQPHAEMRTGGRRARRLQQQENQDGES